MLEIYTDGAYANGMGSWAYYVPAKGHSLTGVVKDTTNNRMELQAIIEAYKYAASLKLLPSEYVIYSDSKYAVDGLNNWVYGWLRNNWRGGQIKNQDMWQVLHALRPQVNKLRWVKGHNGNPGNEYADQLATNALLSNLDSPPVELNYVQLCLFA